MTIAAFKRYLQTSAPLLRVAEVIAFVTYREVREFDFTRTDVPRAPRPAARKS